MLREQGAVVERETLTTLKGCEKEVLGKKKSLNSIIKKPDDYEEQKVTVDKDFAWMKVPFIKPKSNKVKAGEAETYKLADVSGFLKPQRSERSFAAANVRGKFLGRFSRKESAAAAEHGGTSKADPTLNIEDHVQFPGLIK
ncbi:hypothetical protein OWV82_009686 [Melia azedarach]|uniref:Uncharacterized protein n=1 Tax=Melia azedarach TaxID=155640 RepID=A0ACC1Y2M1_MELAZ|nr:hypothetical protein OWV82_009686 [Melia azedarach]